MPPKPVPVRTLTRKAVVASPAAQRVEHLLGGARAFADASPQLAAYLGRRALQVAAESDGPVLPRGAAASLCGKCGLPFTSHVYSCAVVVRLSHQHVRRRLQKAAADAAKGKLPQPVNRAAVRFTCQLCGHAAIRPFVTRQAAEEALAKIQAQHGHQGGSGPAGTSGSAQAGAAAKPPAPQAAEVAPAQGGAGGSQPKARKRGPPEQAAPCDPPRVEAEAARQASIGGAADSMLALAPGTAAAASSPEAPPAAGADLRTLSETRPQRTPQAEQSEEQQSEEPRQELEADAAHSQPETSEPGNKKRRVSWSPRLEHVRQYDGSAASPDSRRDLVMAARAVAQGLHLQWRSWFRVGRAWKVARQ